MVYSTNKPKRSRTIGKARRNIGSGWSRNKKMVGGGREKSIVRKRLY